MSKKIHITKELILDYQKKGLNNRQISKKIGCSETWFSTYLHKKGLCSIKKRLINSHFFKQTSNHNMWYILGLLASDGCISYNKKAGRYSVMFYGEKDILNQVLLEMKGNYSIGRHGKSKSYALHITNKQMYQDLIALGIKERKTFLIELPQMCDQFFFDFLRGEFDGDGCINTYKYRNGYSRSNFNLTSGSKNFLMQIKKRLDLFGISTGCLIKRHSSFTTYILDYYKQESLIKLFELLYDGDDVLKMDRKYEKFKSVVLEIKNK